MENIVKTVPMALLFTSICRTMFVGAQLSDSLIILGLCGLVYLLNNLNYNKKSIEIQQELSTLRTNLEKYEKEISETKQYVSGVKLAGSIMGKK